MVLMDKWDAEETLRLIDRDRVTHTHMVATMFHRLLQLPAEVKARYDTSSLRWVIHGAAPTPVHVKSAMIEWWGPVLYEYYAATEGGTFFVDSHEWLERPGTVGRTVEGTIAKVLDEDGVEVAARTTGTVYFLAPENRFEYFKAPEKTAAAYRGDYFTMGDMGYLDDDGYLFLTGRSAEVIIAGGVNIYPQEIDDVLSPASGGLRSLHRGRAQRGVGRDAGRGGRDPPGHRGKRSPGAGAARLRARTAARLQAAARDPFRDRAAAPPHRKDHAVQGARAVLGGASASDLASPKTTRPAPVEAGLGIRSSLSKRGTTNRSRSASPAAAAARGSGCGSAGCCAGTRTPP